MASFDLWRENWISQQGRFFFLCDKTERNIFQSKTPTNNLLPEEVIFTHASSIRSKAPTEEGHFVQPHTQPARGMFLCVRGKLWPDGKPTCPTPTQTPFPPPVHHPSEVCWGNLRPVPTSTQN